MVRELCHGLAGTATSVSSGAPHVVAALDELLADQQPALLQAFRTASGQAWKVLQDTLSRDPDGAACAAELNQAAAFLEAGEIGSAQIRGYASRFDQYADAAALAKSNAQTLELLAKALKAKMPELAKHLLAEAKRDEPLLVLAARHFVRQAIAADARLQKALGKLPWEPLPASWARHLGTPEPVQPTRPTPQPTSRAGVAPQPGTAAPPTPGPATAEAGAVAALVAQLQQRYNPADLEKVGPMVQALRDAGDPKAAALVKQTREALRRYLTPDTMTFMPRADSRAGVIPGRASLLAWSIQLSLWDEVV